MGVAAGASVAVAAESRTDRNHWMWIDCFEHWTPFGAKMLRFDRCIRSCRRGV
jgi:hypothetical protein